MDGPTQPAAHTKEIPGPYCLEIINIQSFQALDLVTLISPFKGVKFQNCNAVRHYITAAHCHLYMPVVMATVYNNGKTSMHFAGKCQACKS